MTIQKPLLNDLPGIEGKNMVAQMKRWTHFYPSHGMALMIR
jgi:hypothetical protein